MQKSRFKENPEQGLMVLVFNNNLESAIRRLNKKVEDAELMEELKKRAYYLKPSLRKRMRARKRKQ